MPIFSDDEPQVVEVLGRPLRCVVCQHDTFYRREAQMPSGLSTLMNLEWTAPRCDCIVCSGCGYVHWFFPLKGSPPP
jgi:predicted nucleic-acid-binding Zn-ribbon protein